MNNHSFLIANMNRHSYNISEVIIMGKENMPKSKIISDMENMLKIAADSTRLKIMFSLLDDDIEKEIIHERCVSDIQTIVGASQSLVSHQLKVLKDADLVNTRKEGTKVYYSLKDEHVRKLLEVVLEHVLEKQ